MYNSEQLNLLRLTADALQELIKSQDKKLIERGVHERTIAFRLGHYLQKRIKCDAYELNHVQNLVVDAEYNKNGKRTKGVYENCRNCNNDEGCYIKNSKDLVIKHPRKDIRLLQELVMRPKKMMPDLLVHIRDKDGDECENQSQNSYLTIELKTKDDEVLNVIDCAKLAYLTCKKGMYNYKLGVHIVFKDDSLNIYSIIDAKNPVKIYDGPINSFNSAVFIQNFTKN